MASPPRPICDANSMYVCSVCVPGFRLMQQGNAASFLVSRSAQPATKTTHQYSVKKNAAQDDVEGLISMALRRRCLGIRHEAI